MCQKYDGMALITIPLIANQALGALSTSFSWLERDTRRRGAFSPYWDSNAFALGNFAYGVDTRCCDLLMLKASDYLSIRPEMAGEKQEVRYNGLYREDFGKKYRSQCS